MGEISESELLTFMIKPTAYDYIGREKDQITKSDIWKHFYNVIYIPFRRQFQSKVNSLAPADTGKLRRAIIDSITNRGSSNLSRSALFSDGIRVVMNTKDVPYAKPVNRMPTRWVRHPGPKHGSNVNRSDRRGYKYDPEATTEWFNLIRMWARNFILNRIKVFRRVISKYFGGGLKGYNITKTMFSITNGVKSI